MKHQNKLMLMSKSESLKPALRGFLLESVKQNDLNRPAYLDNFVNSGIFGVVEKQRVKILKSDRSDLLVAGVIYDLSRVLEINEILNNLKPAEAEIEMTFEDKFMAFYAGGSHIH